MAWIEILDGPPEWAGAVYESPEVDLASEIGLTHPRWRGTPLAGYWALYAYRKVEVAGDRHRYRYLGPWGVWHWEGRRRHGEDLSGWDVLVVQQELNSDDPRKLWGSPVRVSAAPPRTPRPDPARPPEQQGWQGRTRAAGCAAPGLLARAPFARSGWPRQMAEGNPWVADHWRRLAEEHGPAKDAEVERIEHEQGRMVVSPGRPGSCGGCDPTRCSPGPAPHRSPPGRPTSR